MSGGVRLGVPDQPEAARNALLRRVDWRFLSASPWPNQSVCFEAGALTDAVTAVSRCVVTAGMAAPASCDWAVAVHPQPETLRTAFRLLRPGGTLYVEWRSLPAGGAARARQQLAAAGFENTAGYWTWPSFAQGLPAFWIPTDAPAVLAGFLKSRPVTGPWWVRGWQIAARLAWPLARRANLLHPLALLAVKPLAEPAPSARPKEVRLLLTGGRRSLNKVVALCFAAGADSPDQVIKSARVPEAVPALAREAAMLRAMAGRHPGGLAGLPHVYWFDAAAGAVAESILTGWPLSARLDWRQAGALAGRATDWLIALAGRPQPVLGAPGWERVAWPALERFTELFASIVERDEVARTRACFLSLGALPVVPEHRDFSPWNLMADAGGQIAVPDWEGGEPAGVPGLDLVYFLTYAGLFLEKNMDNGQELASYRNALDPATPLGRLVADNQARYAQALNLPPRVWGPLRVLTWVIHAPAEVARLAADRGGAPTPAQLRGSLFFRLWRAALARVDDFDRSRMAV